METATSPAKKDLQALTDKFLREFFDMAAAIELAERENAKPSDSYSFNYALPKALLNSQYILGEERESFQPLMTMGFVQQIAEGLFQLNIQGILGKLEAIIQSFDKQERYSDWYAKGLKCATTTIEVEEMRFEPLEFFKVKKPKKAYTFTVQSSKSGHCSKVEVSYIDNKLQEATVSLIESGSIDKIPRGNPLFLTIKPSFDFNGYIDNKEVKMVDEAKLHHYEFIPDINSFCSTVDQIIAGIGS